MMILMRTKGGNAPLLALLVAAALTACALPPVGAGYRYFERADAYDPWSIAIARWQARAARSYVSAATGVEKWREGELPGELARSYSSFRSAHKRQVARDNVQKRRVARDVVDWLQAQSRDRFIADGILDHWPTLEETLVNGGDDCDGLELLSFQLLRDFGFARSEVFRGIVQRPLDGQLHMVTLWFEDPADPWVLDPTGILATSMPRMSEVPDWVPLKVFTESLEFTVRGSRNLPGALPH